MPPLCLVPYYAYRPLAALGVSDGFRLFRFFGLQGWKIACRLLPAAGFRVSKYPHGGGGRRGGWRLWVFRCRLPVSGLCVLCCALLGVYPEPQLQIRA